METQNKTLIIVGYTINEKVEKVWEYRTKPEHITQWNNASDDWHTPRTPNEYIELTLGDGRKVQIIFTADGNKTHVKEIFEAESTNSVEMQKGRWQAILDNFKKYTETN